MPLPGTFGTETSLSKMGVRIGVNEAENAVATATATSATVGAVTINAGQGIITSPNLTSSSTWSLIVTNSIVSSGDIVWVQIQAGTNTAAIQASVGQVTVANGTFSVVLSPTNTTAHNGTILVAFQVEKLVTAGTVD